MKALVRWLLLGGVATLSLAPTASFAADGSPVSTAIGTGPPGKTAPNPAYVTAKTAIAREYAAAKSGRFSMTKFLADEKAFESKWYGPPPARPGRQVTSGPCCEHNDLAVNQYPERLDYFCGPSAAYSMLEYVMRPGSTNSYLGESLTQDCLAGTCGPKAPKSTRYLETNYFGNTPWLSWPGDYPFSQSINYWRTGSYQGYYINQRPATEADYEFDLWYDTDHAYPVSVDVWEPVNRIHLFNHPPNIDFKHWITTMGYRNYGALTDYVDPAKSPAIIWSGPVQAVNYGYSSPDMYTMTGYSPFGIVW